MPIGHIAINGQEYRIFPQNYQKSTDNPFAAKLGQGAGLYDDLEGWSASIQDDWRGGIAKTDFGDGGTYVSTLDTRYSGKMFLPPATHMVRPTRYTAPGNVEYTIPLSPGMSIAFTVPEMPSATALKGWVLFESYEPDEVIDVRFQERAVSGGLPEGQTFSNTAWVPITGDSEVYPYGSKFHPLIATGSGMTTGDVIVLQNMGTADVRIPIVPTAGQTTYVQQVFSNEWEVSADVSPLCYFWSIDNNSYPVRFNGQTHFLAFDGKIYTPESDGNGGYRLLQSATGGGFPIDATEYKGELYVANGAGGLKVYNTSYTVTTNDANLDTNVLLRWNNYLYRAYGRNLYYTANGTTWSGPFEVGAVGEIRGMAGVGSSNDILVSTDDALFVFAEGDTTYGVTPWPEVSALNGTSMIHHQGGVFITVGGNRVVRYSEGSLLDVWLKQDDNVPAYAEGSPSSLVSLSGILYMVTDAGPNGYGVVWGWNGEGWHYIAALPYGFVSPRLVADRDTASLWVGNGLSESGNAGQWPFRIPITDYGLPLNETNYQTMTGGWVETDWLDGGLIELDKDWESIYVNLDEDYSPEIVKVYWKVPYQSSWELLGTASRYDSYGEANGGELIWSNLATRPASKKIRLAFQIRSETGETPVLNGLRVKYQINVNDRWRWQIPLDVGNAGLSQNMLDGSVNTRTNTEMIAHLEQAIRSVAPIEFRDVDGVMYTVRVKSATQSIEKFEVFPGDESEAYNSVWYLSISET